MMEEEVTYDYDQLEPIPVGFGLCAIVTSVVIFQLLTQSVQKFLPAPHGVENPWKWRNLLVSWLHAIVIGIWDLSCFYWYPELTTDLIAFHNPYLYTMVAFSTGYFIHDFLDIAINGKLKQMWEVIPHHFAVAGMFFYNVLESRCIAYNVVALLAEVNTIFLHARKLLQMAQVPRTNPVYRVNVILNLSTFIVCRFSGLTWIVVGMYVWGHRVSRIYFCVLAASMFVMWVTNIALFWRLLISDVIREWRRKGGGITSDAMLDLIQVELNDVQSSISGNYELWNDGVVGENVECKRDLRREKCAANNNCSVNGTVSLEREITGEGRQKQQ